MKHLRNPTTGEVRLVTPLQAKRLRKYSWQDVDLKTWTDYQRAKLQLGIAKHVRQAQIRVH